MLQLVACVASLHFVVGSSMRVDTDVEEIQAEESDELESPQMQVPSGTALVETKPACPNDPEEIRVEDFQDIKGAQISKTKFLNYKIEKPCFFAWKLGVRLGRGSQGTIYAAHRNGEEHAVKIANVDVKEHPKLGKQRFAGDRWKANTFSLAREKCIAAHVGTCVHKDNVMQVISPDEDVCVTAPDMYPTASIPDPGAYFMPRMDGDLLQYREKYKEGGGCFNEIAQQVLQGLRCLHVSGFVHLDFKSVNAMFKEGPKGDCGKVNVRVADFGLSKHFEDPSPFCYTEDQYKTYTYLPRSIFDVPTEEAESGYHAAHLVPSFCDKNNSVSVPGYGPRPVVTLATQIDWCTYVYTMRKFKPDFAERCAVAATEEDSEKLIEINCGPMGDKRKGAVTYCGVFDGVDKDISPTALGGIVPVDMRYGLDLAVIRQILAGFFGLV